MMISLIIFCSIHIMAQRDYYYYKGKKIPLFINDDKICVSIPSVSEKTSEILLKNVNVLKKIKDKSFNIVIIHQSDYENLISLDSWKEQEKSVILTRCYTTTEEKEVFSTPYLNVRLKKE